MTALDLSILDWIQARLAGPFGDAVLPWVTRLGDGGIFWIALALLLLAFPKTRPYGAAMALSIAVEVVCCNLILKPLVARVRPYDVNPAAVLLVARPTDFSFPSGHAGVSFAAAGALAFMKTKWSVPALAAAALVGFSRLYLYLHYPSDVLAGLLLGLGTGALAAWLIRRGVIRRWLSRWPKKEKDR